MNGKYIVKVSKLFGGVVLIWISISLWRSSQSNYRIGQLKNQLKTKNSFIPNENKNNIQLNQQINNHPKQDINNTHKLETFQHVCDKTGIFNGYEKNNRVEEMVIYSEMPKCGSGTFVSIIQLTARRASRKHLPTYNTGYTYPVPHEELYQFNKRLHYANGLFEKTPPYLFSGHLRFLDFKEVGHKQPIFIDLVRDPINRTMSAYHYGRQPPFNKRANLTKAETKMSMDECFRLLLNETGCAGAKDLNKCLQGKKLTACKSSGIVERMTTWFSGYGSEVSVNKAKSNIDKYYLVIGVTEHYTESLTAFGALLPPVFNVNPTTLVEIYKTISNKNVGRNVKQPSEETKAILRNILSEEYELYQFILQRFFKQLKCLGIGLRSGK